MFFTMFGEWCEISCSGSGPVDLKPYPHGQLAGGRKRPSTAGGPIMSFLLGIYLNWERADYGCDLTIGCDGKTDQ